MIGIGDVEPNPWSRYGWSGCLRSGDGTSTADFVRADVARVVAWYSTGDRWDGETAGIIELTDGRFVSWEAEYGPTGDGFCHDAYGGEADIFFSSSVEFALMSLGDVARETLTGQVQ